MERVLWRNELEHLLDLRIQIAAHLLPLLGLRCKVDHSIQQRVVVEDCGSGVVVHRSGEHGSDMAPGQARPR